MRDDSIALDDLRRRVRKLAAELKKMKLSEGRAFLTVRTDCPYCGGTGRELRDHLHDRTTVVPCTCVKPL